MSNLKACRTATTIPTHLFLESDKAESSRTLRIAVDHHHGVRDLAKLLEVVTEVLLRHGGGQAAHKDFLLLREAAAAESSTSATAEIATLHQEYGHEAGILQVSMDRHFRTGSRPACCFYT